LKKIIFFLALNLIVFQGGSNSNEIVSGVLRGGMMAIGGETTGFFLLNDKKRLEVSLPQTVIKNFSEWNGKKVTLKGKTIIVKGIERGQRKIFKASSVQKNDEDQAKLKVIPKEEFKTNFVSRVLRFFGLD
jgi:hypothetical protein